METKETTLADKWMMVYATVILTVFIGGFGLLMCGLLLASNPDNFEQTHQFEMRLEKLNIEENVKLKDHYTFTATMGAARIQEKLEIHNKNLSEEKVEVVQIPVGESQKVIVTDYRLKNDFFDGWMKKYNHPRKYTFYVHEEN